MKKEDAPDRRTINFTESSVSNGASSALPPAPTVENEIALRATLKSQTTKLNSASAGSVSLSSTSLALMTDSSVKVAIFEASTVPVIACLAFRASSSARLFSSRIFCLRASASLRLAAAESSAKCAADAEETTGTSSSLPVSPEIPVRARSSVIVTAEQAALTSETSTACALLTAAAADLPTQLTKMHLVACLRTTMNAAWSSVKALAVSGRAPWPVDTVEMLPELASTTATTQSKVAVSCRMAVRHPLNSSISRLQT